MQKLFHLVLAVSISLILSGLELMDKLTAKRLCLLKFLLLDSKNVNNELLCLSKFNPIGIHVYLS